VEGIDDFGVLDIRDSIPDIAEIFHVVPEAFIMLLFGGLYGFNYRRTLIRTLKVSNKHDT
jgi:hypothetical protein